MPMRLNVGLNRKVVEPNFGSRGASINFEVELESNLVREPEQLREKIRYLFRQAKEAVDEELKRGDGPTQSNGHANGQPNGSLNGNGNFQSHARPRMATVSQVRAIESIAQRLQLDLTQWLQSKYGLRLPAELSINDASATIDELKATTNCAQKGGDN